jgi:hypothetical protein
MYSLVRGTALLESISIFESPIVEQADVNTLSIQVTGVVFGGCAEICPSRLIKIRIAKIFIIFFFVIISMLILILRLFIIK